MTSLQTNGHHNRLANAGVVENTIEGFWRFAQMVAKSGMAPRSLKTPEQVMVALQMGSELGLKPMQSLQSIAVINGKPSVWGDAAKALVERSAECEYVKEWTEGDGEKLVAYCEAKRVGRPEPHRSEFSWQDAKRAGLASKDTYKQYPKRMLQMRARAFALRDQFADLLCGFGLAEEAQDIPGEVKPRLVSGDTQPSDDLDAIVGELVDASSDAPTPEEAPELYTTEETNA